MYTDSPTTLSQKHDMADILRREYDIALPGYIVNGMYLSQLRAVMRTIREASVRGRTEIRTSTGREPPDTPGPATAPS